MEQIHDFLAQQNTQLYKSINIFHLESQSEECKQILMRLILLLLINEENNIDQELLTNIVNTVLTFFCYYCEYDISLFVFPLLKILCIHFKHMFLHTYITVLDTLNDSYFINKYVMLLPLITYIIPKINKNFSQDDYDLIINSLYHVLNKVKFNNYTIYALECIVKASYNEVSKFVQLKRFIKDLLRNIFKYYQDIQYKKGLFSIIYYSLCSSINHKFVNIFSDNASILYNGLDDNFVESKDFILPVLFLFLQKSPLLSHIVIFNYFVEHFSSYTCKVKIHALSYFVSELSNDSFRKQVDRDFFIENVLCEIIEITEVTSLYFLKIIRLLNMETLPQELFAEIDFSNINFTTETKLCEQHFLEF